MGFLLAQAYHYQGQDLLNCLVEEIMSTNLLDQIFERRFAERFEQGIEQGATQGRREMLRRYLERRFGTIPPALDRRIAAAGSEELTTMFDQAVSAGTIDEM
jgi:hypothetical protein